GASSIVCDKSTQNSKHGINAKKMSAAERKEKVINQKCCFACLKPGHRVQECKSQLKCGACSGKHYSFMCHRKTGEPSSGPIGTSLTGLSFSSEVILETLLVNVVTGNRKKTVRALLDTASQRSYILNKTVRKLGLVPERNEKVNHELFGGSTYIEGHGQYNLRIEDVTGQYGMNLTVLDIPKI